MKEPKLSDLKIDERGTKKMSKEMSKVNKVKITINFDADLLESLKQTSEKRAYLTKRLQIGFFEKPSRKACNKSPD